MSRDFNIAMQLLEDSKYYYYISPSYVLSVQYSHPIIRQFEALLLHFIV